MLLEDHNQKADGFQHFNHKKHHEQLTSITCNYIYSY